MITSTNDLGICESEVRFEIEQQLQLFSGIELVISEAHQLWNDQGAIDKAIVSWNFWLSGSKRSDALHAFNVAAGKSDFGYYSELKFVPQSAPLTLITINVELAMLKTIVAEQCFALPIVVQQLMKGDDSGRDRLKEMSPEMLLVAGQILNCSYQGMNRRLYLASKAIELIALHFHQLLAASEPRDGCDLKREDVDRIYHAKEILLSNLENPPSLLVLAHQVGLNDNKLKRGFRQVFGTTAFGYLHQQRMKQAQNLLATRGLSVTEVAQAVGYSSLSAFNAAFKKQFGFNPSVYRSVSSK